MKRRSAPLYGPYSSERTLRFFLLFLQTKINWNNWRRSPSTPFTVYHRSELGAANQSCKLIKQNKLFHSCFRASLLFCRACANAFMDNAMLCSKSLCRDYMQNDKNIFKTVLRNYNVLRCILLQPGPKQFDNVLKHFHCTTVHGSKRGSGYYRLHVCVKQNTIMWFLLWPVQQKMFYNYLTTSKTHVRYCKYHHTYHVQHHSSDTQACHPSNVAKAQSLHSETISNPSLRMTLRFKRAESNAYGRIVRLPVEYVPL